MTDTTRAPERYVRLAYNMEPSPHGDWVRWDDYRALMNERDRALAGRAAVIGQVADIVHGYENHRSWADWASMDANIRALTPTDAQAALDRLIAEAEERGAQKAVEACAEALWDACPLDQIVTGAYVKRAQHVIRNRGKRDE